MPQDHATLEHVATHAGPTANFALARSQQTLAPYCEREFARTRPREAPETLSGLVALHEADAIIRRLLALREAATSRVTRLTVREHQIMKLIVAGEPNKNIAADLDINQRTVENHRASIMHKTGTKSLPALVRLALLATWIDDLDLKS